MKNFTKKLLKISSIVAATAGVLFGAAAGVNAVIENDNNEKISQVKREKERFEKENREIIKEKKYTQFTYEREKVINNKSVDFSKFTVPTELFTKNDYINPFVYKGSASYRNFQTNKNLYVYMDSNLTQTQKQMVTDCVRYINTVVHTIDPQYSCSITSNLGTDRSYIHVKNDSNYNIRVYEGTVLGVTELPEYPAPNYNDPIKIFMLEDDINRMGGDKVYKAVFLHEFWHAAGLDHNRLHENEGYLSTPIMSPSAIDKDYLSIPELASIFSWLNDEKYQEAQNNGTLQEVCNSDFFKYLALIKTGLQESEFFNTGMTSTTDLDEKQIFQLQYDETPEDGVDNKTTITFNYPFKDFCEKTTTKEDGSVEKTVSPFIFVKKDDQNSKFVVLSSDCRHVEDITLQYDKNIGSSLYKNGLSYDEVMKELKTMDPKNGYTVNAEATMREKHFEYETQNLWQHITGTTQKNDIMISEQLYRIYYNYNWKVNDILAEETTNQVCEEVMNSYKAMSHIGEEYEKN